jgi:hypothetical protein
VRCGVLYAVRPRHLFTRESRARLVSLALGAALVATVAACDDPLGINASTAVQFDTLNAFAMSGTPPGFPSALNTLDGLVVRVDAGFAYDLAMDITPQGGVLLIPVRLMGGQVTASRAVGLQKSTAPFDQILRAPNSGYEFDSSMVAQPGEPVLIQVSSVSCSFALSPLLYSKLIVDSIKPQARIVYFRLVRDPNCGFRSFAPGIPEN